MSISFNMDLTKFLSLIYLVKWASELLYVIYEEPPQKHRTIRCKLRFNHTRERLIIVVYVPAFDRK